MRLQRFSNYILQHRLVALVLTFAITFVPVIGIFGIIIAAFMTLTKGIIEGALFTIAATIPYFVTIGLPHHAADTPLVLWAAVGVAVLSNVLTWVFAAMLRRQSTWSNILQVAALMGVLVVSVVHLAQPNVDAWWGQQLQAYYTKAETVAADALNVPASKVESAAVNKVQTVVDTTASKIGVSDIVKAASPVSNELGKTSAPAPTVVSTTTASASVAPASSNVRMDAINETKQYATGLMLAAILFNALLQLVVARWWQSVLYYPRGLRRELHGIRLSLLASILFVAALVLAYMGNPVVIDMMPIVYLLFTVAGLSLIHWMFGINKSNTTWFWIMLLYVGLVISMPMSLVFISSLAAVDVWLNIRKRLRKF